MEIVKQQIKSDYERGREAWLAGFELAELCSWPSLQYLEAYFGERFSNHNLGVVAAAAVRHCMPVNGETVLKAICALPEEAIDALNLALTPSSWASMHNIKAVDTDTDTSTD